MYGIHISHISKVQVMDNRLICNASDGRNQRIGTLLDDVPRIQSADYKDHW